MNGACLCGAVTIRLPGPPEFLNACNCSLCWKLGALWAYYPASKVAFAGERRGYVRADVAEPSISADFCGQCGATTNWRFIAPGAADRMGVNVRLFDPAALAGIEVRYGDRRNHGLVPRRQYRPATAFADPGDAC